MYSFFNLFNLDTLHIFFTIIICFFIFLLFNIIYMFLLNIIKHFDNITNFILCTIKKTKTSKKKKKKSPSFIKSSSGQNPKPPRKNWRERIKNHFKSYKKYYIGASLFIIGCVIQLPISVEINNFKDILHNINMSNMDTDSVNNHVSSNKSLSLYKPNTKLLHSLVHYNFNKLDYYNELFEKLNLNFGLDSTLINLYKIQNSLLNLNMDLHLNYYWNYKVLHIINDPINLSNFILSQFDIPIELINSIKESKMFSNRLDFDRYKLIKKFYDLHLTSLNVNKKVVISYFQTIVMDLSYDPDMIYALRIYKIDLFKEISLMYSSTQGNTIENKVLASMFSRRALHIMYGSYYDGNPKPIVHSINQLVELKKGLFIQALRAYYLTQKALYPSFDLDNNPTSYYQFYNFYFHLINHFNKLPGPDIDDYVDFNCIHIIQLFDSLNYNDFVHVDETSILPTTLTDDEHIKLKFIIDNYLRRKIYHISQISQD